MVTSNKGEHLGGSPDQSGHTLPSGFDPVESDIRRYRRRRERRTKAERRRDSERHHVTQLSTQAREVEDILAFARIWAPFGGVPEDETFIKFGMRPWQFIERLWRIVSETPCDRVEVAHLLQAYPPIGVAVPGPDPEVPNTPDGHPLPGCAP